MCIKSRKIQYLIKIGKITKYSKSHEVQYMIKIGRPLHKTFKMPFSFDRQLLNLHAQ